MGIESARIVAGSTVGREEVRINCLPLYTNLPNSGAVTRKWDSVANEWGNYTILNDRDIFGMIAVVEANQNIASVYVAIDGEWKPVRTSSQAIDPATGKPWDPLAGFYTPLAS